MGQLFDRASRLIRSELNSNKGIYERDYLNEGTALVAGGAVAGASVGKVGVLAGGTGYSLSAIPLIAAGALTGAALYEALRSVIEGDKSSVGAAATGAAAGVATSAAVGGVGVAVGGSAIGVGMASMAAGGAVVGLGLAGLHRLLQQGIDPEALLDMAIEQMKADLQNARQASINVMAAQIRLQQQRDQAQAEVCRWERRAELALQKGDENLAREALIRKKSSNGILRSIEVQLDQKPYSVKNLRRNLTLLENKISEAETIRTRLKRQIADAKANIPLQKIVGNLGTSSAMSAFERMEQKVLQMEARSQTAAELAGADLESQFAQLESGSNVDAELAAMKAQLLDGADPNQVQLTGTQTTSSAPRDAEVDAELEALKTQLDQL